MLAVGVDSHQPKQPLSARGIGLRGESPGGQRGFGPGQHGVAARLQRLAPTNAVQLTESEEFKFAGGFHRGQDAEHMPCRER